MKKALLLFFCFFQLVLRHWHATLLLEPPTPVQWCFERLRPLMSEAQYNSIIFAETADLAGLVPPMALPAIFGGGVAPLLFDPTTEKRDGNRDGDHDRGPEPTAPRWQGRSGERRPSESGSLHMPAHVSAIASHCTPSSEAHAASSVRHSRASARALVYSLNQDFFSTTFFRARGA